MLAPIEKGSLRRFCLHPFSLTVLACSLCFNLWLVYWVNSPLLHIYSDMQGYVERGWRLAQGGPFYPFDTFYPPGTSYVYAVVMYFFGYDRGLKVLVALQPALLTASYLLLALCAMLLFGKRRLAFVVLAFCAAYFPFAAQGCFFMAEPVFMFLLALSFFIYLTTLRGSHAAAKYFLLGLLVAFATLVKSQGGILIVSVLLVPVFDKEAQKRARLLPLFLLAFVLPLLAQVSVNSAIMKRPSVYIAANNDYNMYLGQSRRAAVGCLDPVTGYFYIFYNTNTGLGYKFREAAAYPVAIWDRSFFKQKTWELWHSNPRLQVLRSLQNAFELYSINPRWPLRNNPQLVLPDTVSQWFFLFLVVLPALSFSFSALRVPQERSKVFFLGLPILGIFGVAFISMGQPRYLLPFNYFLLLLACPFYEQAFQRRTGLVSRLVGAFVFVVALAGVREAARAAYESTLPAPREKSQEKLEAPLKNTEPLFLAYTGFDNQLVSVKKQAGGVTVSLENFEVGEMWSREVYWHADADAEGRVKLVFPPGSANKIGLFFTDGDGYRRISYAAAGADIALAERLHNGRWIFFTLNAEQQKSGQAEVVIRRLMGRSAALSAIALF